MLREGWQIRYCRSWLSEAIWGQSEKIGCAKDVCLSYSIENVLDFSCCSESKWYTRRRLHGYLEHYDLLPLSVWRFQGTVRNLNSISHTDRVLADVAHIVSLDPKISFARVMCDEYWRVQDYEINWVATIRWLVELIRWADYLGVTDFNLNGVYCSWVDIFDDAGVDSDHEVVAHSW